MKEENIMCEFNDAIECNCTYECPKHAKCCECVEHHRKAGGFPACFFSAKAEKTYDRSLEALLRDRQG